MKRTLFAVAAALAILIVTCGVAGALNIPHNDYRGYDLTNGYQDLSCSSGAACHSITKNKFLPETLDSTAAPNERNFNNFCVTCHNVSGEAHDKSVGAASTNAYIGMTTADTAGKRGNSHNWNGINGNGGTTSPTSAGIGGTSHMPAGNTIVACQVCHDAMNKNSVQDLDWVPATVTSDYIHYQFGYVGTAQYLSQYIKVYRNLNSSVARPGDERGKKAYLVAPSEYTYDPSTATITFKTAQSTGAYIYVDIPQPYFRSYSGNVRNTLCLDCHKNRIDRAVSHAPGTGVKDNHPVTVPFGNRSGLHDTLLGSPNANIYIEGNKVLCTACHDPHNAASDDGMLLRNADGSNLCGDCHKTKLTGYSTAGSVNMHNGYRHGGTPTVCLDCHTTHGTGNILLIRDNIAGKKVTFRSFTGANSFGDNSGTSLCEVCHSGMGHHNNTVTADHYGKQNCTQCHTHETGFQPPSGGGGACDSCHGFPPSPTKAGPSGWADTTGDKHPAHMTYIQNKYGLTGLTACGCCHGSKPGGTHPEGLLTAWIDTSSPTYWGGGTFTPNLDGKTSTADDTCTSVKCHANPATRTWGGAAATCDSCHPYPGSTWDWDVTGGYASNNGHMVRRDGVSNIHMAVSGYNAATDDYVSVTSDPSRCGKCHPPNTIDKHNNGVINLAGNGYAACGPATDFTITVNTSRSDVTCSNVICHTGGNTPNWW